MAYAQPQDMVARYGQAEMIRLSVGEGQPLDVMNLARINVALADASALIDSYLRRRYATPLAAVPQEVLRAACILARYDLAHGDGRMPSEQMTTAQKQILAWLEAVRDGKTMLADATPSGQQAFGQVQSRGSAPYQGVGTPPPTCAPFGQGGFGGAGAPAGGGDGWTYTQPADGLPV